MTRTVSTAELISAAESKVGRALTSELAAYFDLVRDVTNVAGSLVEEIENAPGEPRSIHVGAFLLSRLITDLQACAALVRQGYAAQALSLTAGMLELAHTSMHVGADEARAQAWLAHADVKHASPWRLKTTIHAVAQEMGVPDTAAEREYDQIYNQSCMAKHGHPIALGMVGVVSDEDATYIVAGPYLSDSVRRWSHVALAHGIRYTKLTALKFIRDHLSGSPREQLFLDEMKRLTVIQRELGSADVQEFGGVDEDG